LTVLVGGTFLETFEQLPVDVQNRATRSIDLLSTHPRMYPIRRRGLMRGYRYFIAGRYLFFYSVASTEVRLTAIIPAAMRLA